MLQKFPLAQHGARPLGRRAAAAASLRAARAALAGRPDAAALADACFHSADLVEGITAFEESRYPSFEDR